MQFPMATRRCFNWLRNPQRCGPHKICTGRDFSNPKASAASANADWKKTQQSTD